MCPLNNHLFFVTPVEGFCVRAGITLQLQMKEKFFSLFFWPQLHELIKGKLCTNICI